MAGITRVERERRHTEDVLAVMERPFTDRSDVVVFVGPIQRAYCGPCQRRAWGAQVRIGRGDEFRCLDCLRAIETTIHERITQIRGHLALPAAAATEYPREGAACAGREPGPAVGG
jgi:hypothetical protein